MSSPVAAVRRVDRGLLLRVGLGFVAAAVVLATLLATLDLPRLLRSLAGADPTQAVGAAVLALVGVACWAGALGTLLVAAGLDLGRRQRLAAFSTGYLAKQVVPFGGVSGPAVTSYAIGRNNGMDAAVAAVTVAEVLLLVTSLGLGLVGAAFTLSSGAARGVVALLVGAVVGVAGLLLLALGLARYRRRTLRRVVRVAAVGLRYTLGRLSPRIGRALSPATVRGHIQQYVTALGTVAEDRGRIRLALALSLAGWLAFAAALVVSAGALGQSVPFVVAAFLVPAAGLAALVPLPGGLGGVELALTGALVVLGSPLVVAAAVVVLYRLATYWVPLAATVLVVTATVVRAQSRSGPT